MKVITEPRFVRGLLLVASAVSINLLLGAGGVAPAAAESADQTSAPASDELEDVIITARRIEEPQQRVPVVVTALSQKDLDQQMVLNVQDLQTSTPGLFVGTNSQTGAPSFAIRGAKEDNGTSNTVAVYIDDVPVNSTLSVGNMVYDMQSISTLYGPQGTLFGANSTGGAIVFRPNKPTDTFEGYAQVGFGKYDRKEFQGMVNIPVNEVLQVRLAGEIVRRDGFETNFTPNTPSNRKMDDDDHDSLRASVRLRLSDTLLNDTVVDYYHIQDQPNQEWAAFFRPTFEYPTFLGFSVPVSYAAAGLHPLPPFDVQTSAAPSWNKATLYGVANTTTWDVTPTWALKNVIGYRHDKTDESTDASDSAQFGVVEGRTAYDTQQWSWEPSSTITWDDGRWSNKTGIFLLRTAQFEGISFQVEDEPWDFAGFPPSTQPLVYSFYPLQLNEIANNVFKSEALYDQASVKLSQELTFTAGARYTYDQGSHIESDRLSFPSTPNGGLGPWGDFNYGPCETATVSTYQNYNAAACTGTRSLRSNAPSFTLSLEDQFAERKMLYTSLRGGYLVGGFNTAASSPAGQVFGPEKVTEVEGGFKADWDAAGRPFRTNVALFYGTYRDQQRVQNLTAPDGVTYIAVQNAGSALFYGADIDLNYVVSSYLDLEASWEYLIAQYTNYNAAVSVPGITAAVDLTGTQEAQAPKDVFTAAATLKWPVSDKMGALSTTLSYYYRSQSYGHDGPTIGGSCAGNTVAHPVTTCTAPGSFIPNPAQSFTAYDILPAFGIANVTTRWKGIAGTHIDAELWVKNLTNKVYYTYSYNNALEFGYATYWLGDPRTFGARLRYNF